MNEISTRWGVLLLLKEQLEELDHTTLLGKLFSSVSRKTFLLANKYLISLRIRGGWCLIPHIYQDVDIRDPVIQQVFIPQFHHHFL